MSNFSFDPWFEEADRDPRKWILEDSAMFQQVFAEVGETGDSTPRRQEPIYQRKKTKVFRSRRKSKKTEVLEGIPEDEREESDKSQPWLIADGSEEEGDGRDYYMSGALGVRNVEGVVIGGGDGSGDPLVGVCEDEVKALKLDGDEISGEGTAGSPLGNSEASVLTRESRKRDKGKARVRFDVQIKNSREYPRQGQETRTDQPDNTQVSGSSREERPRKAKHPSSQEVSRSGQLSHQQSHTGLDGEDISVSRRTMGEFL